MHATVCDWIVCNPDVKNDVRLLLVPNENRTREKVNYSCELMNKEKTLVSREYADVQEIKKLISNYYSFLGTPQTYRNSCTRSLSFFRPLLFLQRPPCNFTKQKGRTHTSLSYSKFSLVHSRLQRVWNPTQPWGGGRGLFLTMKMNRPRGL